VEEDAWHGTTLLPRDARALQDELRERVVRERDFGPLRLVAGVDISVKDDRAWAAVVVLAWPKLEVVERRTATRALEFPYVPGLLSFRELPSIFEAYAALEREPELLFVDGHGLAHPRRFGIACHLGLALDKPSIGCGKSILVGKHREPLRKRGSRRALVHDGETIGCALRTRDGVNPVYVSIGHRIDLETAVRLVLRASPRYRVPEPVRQAHIAAGEARLSWA
jgi:deoxyribonuclease V